MNEQLDLLEFGVSRQEAVRRLEVERYGELASPVARRSDPETSHQAAARARGKAETNRALALRTLQDAGTQGLTDFELAESTGIPQTSIGVRRHELVGMGLVVKTSRRRLSPSGCPAIVWVAL